MSLVQAASVKRQLKLGAEDLDHVAQGADAAATASSEAQLSARPQDQPRGQPEGQPKGQPRGQPEALPQPQGQPRAQARPEAQAANGEPHSAGPWDSATAWQKQRTGLSTASRLMAVGALLMCAGLIISFFPRKGDRTGRPAKLEQGELESYLCQDLVVPADSECTLTVPLGGPEQESFKVTDAQGADVLQVVFRMLQPVANRIGQVLLTTSTGEVLAQCSRVSECQLLCAAGELYGTLARDGNEERYTLFVRDVEEMHFIVSAQPLAISMTDARGRLLALFEMPKYAAAGTLRVAPMMDASIALCAALAINHLA